MEIRNLFQCETARQDVYKGFAECYYLPDDDLVNRLKNMEYQLGLLGSKALYYVVLMRSEIQKPDYLEKLQIEFSKLFIGPYSLLAPPYGSVYLEGARKVMGDSTMDVIGRYESAGLSVSESFKDVPDHIAAELEFMYYLVFKNIEAIQSDAYDAAYKYMNHQRMFLEDHLGNWISGFSQTISSHAEIDFYRNLAIATRLFIEEDLAGISYFDLSAKQEVLIQKDSNAERA